MVRRIAAPSPVGAGLGLVLDRVLGEPPAPLHPVAGFGRLMAAFEHATYLPRRDVGIAYTTFGALVGASAGLVIGSTALGVGTGTAGRMLRAHARGVRDALVHDGVDEARARLPALVGRDPSTLDGAGIAAAAVESVAENTVDAVVAPALWGATFGAPGALGYRAVNTMDAMVGHHTERYEQYGWCSARADDVMNLVPARVAAALVIAVRPRRAAAVLDAALHQARAHPSPNAGVVEAAFAAALGVELGGPLRYGTREEDRPRLGRGPRPGPDDIERACVLSSHVELALAAVLVTAGLAARSSRRRRARSGR
jgi:adenosylcobinamide-phosphate synthase